MRQKSESLHANKITFNIHETASGMCLAVCMHIVLA